MRAREAAVLTLDKTRENYANLLLKDILKKVEPKDRDLASMLVGSAKGLLEVLKGEFAQLCFADILLARQPVGLLLDAFLEHVAHVAGISEVAFLMPHNAVKFLREILLGLSGQRVLVLPYVHLKYIRQFACTIIGEVNVACEARLQTWIGVNEALHLFGVARDDDNKFVAVVFHAFEQCGDGFLSIVLSIASFGHKCISLVNEEHSIEG